MANPNDDFNLPDLNETPSFSDKITPEVNSENLENSQPQSTNQPLEKVKTQLKVLTEKIKIQTRTLYRKMKKKWPRLFPKSRRRYDKQLMWVRLMRAAAVLSLVGLIAGVIMFLVAFAWVSRNLPSPGEVVRHEGFSSKILDRNGELIYELYQEERRDPVPFDQIPDNLKEATIAIEDRDFYKHKGFDFLTIFRIPYNLVFRQRVVGGSTLTQQLVKNVLLTNERTVTRKFKELVLALQIERKFTKDQILEMYLNEAPYGGTAWGVGAAAESYFDKDVNELSLVESAILAGLPQRPSAYSPFLGRTDEDGELLWKIRATGVLIKMKESEYISQEEYDQAINDLDFIEFERADLSIKAPHFVFYVKDQLIDLFGEDLVDRGGFEITTSLDLELQEKSQEIVADEIEDIEELNITNGSAMAMDPQTGEILVMVGSRDYFSEDIDGQFNVAVDGLRQPGSSIKPLTYLMMFQQGYYPSYMITDVETIFTPNDDVDEPYSPKNYDGKFRGPVSLRNALGSSLNIPAVKSLAMVGVENFMDQAYKMGFDTFEPTEENLKRFGLALTLGGGEVHLIDTVTAYSAFANGGTRVEPIAILEVKDLQGNSIYKHQQAQGPEVMTPGEAFLINDVLSDNTARFLAFGNNSLLNLSPNVAVKTGTTNLQKDNWTIGWSQNLIVGTWVGNNDNSSMTYVASGITGASPIWRDIFEEALSMGYKTSPFEKPNSVKEVEVDKISGYPAHDDFESRKDYFIRGTIPTTPDPIHTKIKVCRGDERKLATQARITAGDYEEKEFVALREEDPVSMDGKNRWQEAINAWVEAQEGDLYKPPTEYCGDSEEITVKLSRPENEKSYSEQEVEVHIDAGSDQGIKKIELWVDGSLRETINTRSYRGTINLSTGQHELYAKALSRQGKWAESNKVKIGTGGADWKEPEPSPSPSPSPSPTPSLSPSPSPSPEASPSPTP
jgi:penicillin-binding protein 1C